MIKPTETLYKRVGRKYIPVSAHWSDCNGDQMATGTFRLTYAYADGGKRYEYEVTPDTAAAVAAMTIAKKAMAGQLPGAHPCPNGDWTRPPDAAAT
jgi:hypothetical protein